MNLTVREVLDRYGPALAIVMALVALVVFIPGNGGNEQQVSSAPASEGSPTTEGEVFETGGAIASPDTTNPGTGGQGSPTTVAGAGGASTSGGGSGGGSAAGDTTTGNQTGSSGTGSGGAGDDDAAPSGAAAAWNPQHGPGNYPEPTSETECREDGAMPGYSQYSNPCLPLFEGADNGGATAQGVTADSVKVVWYNNQTNAATQAALTGAGADDNDETIRHDIENFFRYYNLHRETYGRQVEVVEFEGTGDSTDDNVLRADAVAIAQNEKPFAVFHHSVSMGAAFSEELGARDVICVCTTSAPRSLYTDFSPYLYTILPVLDEYYSNIAEYVGKRLNGKPPKYAGSPPPGRLDFNETRQFGLVFLEGSGSDVNPRVQPVVDKFKQELAQYGAELAIDIGYQYDVARAQQQSTNIIGQLINAGVNNVIFVGDPLYPIFLTQAASQQNYNPEWLITGTGLVDTTFFGRTYDQNQWSRAFGISPLWVFARLEETSGWNTADHVDPGGEKGVGINVYQAPIQTIFSGIHLAGPTLTHERFAEGLFQTPATGGTINAPLVKFTRQNPGALKDWVEVWWDGDRQGKDEQDRDGVGMLVKAKGGARYQLSQWPNQDPFAFEDDPDPITETETAEIWFHGEDGHTHEDDAACRSCGPTTHE